MPFREHAERDHLAQVFKHKALRAPDMGGELLDRAVCSPAKLADILVKTVDAVPAFSADDCHTPGNQKAGHDEGRHQGIICVVGEITRPGKKVEHHE